MLEKIEIIKEVEKKIKKRDYKEALGEITRCLELYPNFIVAKVLKAECLLNLNNAEEALALVNEVLFSAPDNIKARKIAVESNLKVGNIDEAKSHVDFLSFLLPANHPYLDEIKKRISESESLENFEEQTEKFEIERTAVITKEEENVVDSDVKEESDIQSDFTAAEVENAVSKEEQHVDIQINEDLVEKKSEKIEDKTYFDENKDEVNQTSLKEEIEEVKEDEIVTGVLQEQISTVTLPDKREEPEIKTRTLALIYERQGMFQEALEILENLFEETKDMELLNDIERIKTKLKGEDKSKYIVAKIKILENWLERVKWHSSN